MLITENLVSSCFFLGTEGKRGRVAEGGEGEDSEGQHQAAGCQGAIWWPGVDIGVQYGAGELPTSM